MTERFRTRTAGALLLPVAAALSGCSRMGAPSFELFGAFFPAWMLCALIGIAGSAATRAVFVGTGLSNAVPHQLLVCTAAGMIAAMLAWLLWFGQ
jgi:YtcA family